jgi:hypothetical protein
MFCFLPESFVVKVDRAHDRRKVQEATHLGNNAIDIALPKETVGILERG